MREIKIYIEGVTFEEVALVVLASPLGGATIQRAVGVWKGEKKEEHTNVTPCIIVTCVVPIGEWESVHAIAQKLVKIGDQVSAFVTTCDVGAELVFAKEE